MYNLIDVAVVKVMLIFVTFMCMVFHNQTVVEKRKERNFNLTKNREYIPIQILQIIFNIQQH